MIGVLIRMFIMMLVIVAFIVIIMKTGILDVILPSKDNKKSKVDVEGYIELYQKIFSKSGSIPDTFNKLMDEYPVKSKEYKVIKKASDYLTESVIKDYRTAFDLIEAVICSDTVKEMHNASIIIVRDNRKFLITTRKRRRSFD